jgi:hypothetical protein
MLADVVASGGDYPYATIAAILVLCAGAIWNGTRQSEAFGASPVQDIAVLRLVALLAIIAAVAFWFIFLRTV